MAPGNHFDRSLLPAPRSFYSREFGGLPRENSQGWVSVPCCFHSSGEKRGRPSKSLRVNTREGNFICMNCGVKGGDPVAFIMQRDRVDFKRAAQSLGAWKDGGLSPEDRERIARDRRKREKEWERFEALEAARKRERIAVRDTLHTAEKLERECRRDLSRLRNLPDGSPEKENAWTTLALLCDPIRELDTSYRELSGLDAA
jgi:CHC2 zinc finger